MATAAEITIDADTGAAVFGFTTTTTVDMAAAIVIAGDTFAPTAGDGAVRDSGGACGGTVANRYA